MTVRKPPAILIFTIALLAGLLASAMASIRPPDDKSSNLLLISATHVDANRLRGLEAVLKQHYGVAAADREIGGTSQSIEARIFGAMRSLRTNDVLIVVVDLPLTRAKNYERVLETSDFDPARPWTGLPTLTLQKLASVSLEGTVVLVFPDCPVNVDMASQMVVQSSQMSLHGLGKASRTLISYCAAGRDDAGSLYNSLSQVLDSAAREPVSRAVWQGRLEKGLVSLSDITRDLRQSTRDRYLSINLNAGGGWLRVFNSDASSQLPVAGANAHPKEVAAALRDLNSSHSADIQIKAIYTLANNRVESARGDLARLLMQSRDDDVRAASARGLGNLPSNEVGEAALISATGDADMNVRIEALSALARVGNGADTHEALRRGLHDPEAVVRETAIYGLGRHWDSMTLPDATAATADALRLLRTDREEAVLAATIRTLAKTRQQDVLPDLLQIAASDDTTRLRQAALDGLAEIGDSRAVSMLIPIARDAVTTADGLRIRLTAIHALGKLDTLESTDALLALAADPIPAVATAAASGLARRASASALIRELAASDATPRGQRILAIQTLGRNDNGAAAHVLFGLLRSHDAEIRTHSIAALRGQNDQEVLDRLGALLLSTTEELAQRVSAAEALSGRLSSDVTATLIRATEDSNDEVRAAAATALASSPSGHAQMKALLRLADDKSSLVREAVLNALGKYGAQNTEVRKVLETIAKTDRDPMLSSLATQTLRDLDLTSSTRVAAVASEKSDFGPFRPGQEKLRIRVFWCEGEGDQRLQDRAKAYVADVRKFAESIRNEDQVIASISLRSISEKRNALPGYQVTQDELRYELGDPSERRWAERLRIGSGEKFVPRPVSTPTPGYLSVFVCALTTTSGDR